MTTEFQMPAPATHYNPHPPQYPSQQFSLYSSQPVSPASSNPTTPQGSSPTSPRSSTHLSTHTRQLRPQKSPLYVPAVLRPSRPPRRKTGTGTLTPPSTNDGLDSPALLRSDSDNGKWGLGRLMDSSEWRGKPLGRVTDLPSRDHWKPDSDASICDAPSCTRTFSYFTRRHHCRRCGNIFCDTHSPHLVPLDQNASFHPLGHRSRACEFCWSECKGWEVSRSSRSGSRHGSDIVQGGGNGSGSGSGSEDGSEGMPATPVISCRGNGAFDAANVVKGIPESVPASVPRDWNWSTF
ncbi:Zn finger protein [Pseudogymnoascus australis]